MTIKKAVIAVAGFGTRFLPATKAVPKELLPIVNKPVVQYLVEEAVSSGIEDIILVLRSGTKAIADHFASSLELESQLEHQHKEAYLEIIKAIPELANIVYVWQSASLPYGNGSPLLAAKHFINEDEAFVYMFGDDLVISERPCVRQLLDVYERYHPSAVVAVQDVPREETCRYGIVKLKPGREPMEMESLVEKPSPEEAPSTLAQFGRFVLPPKILDILDKRELGQGDELWLADAIDKLCHNESVIVHPIRGKWLTTGDPLRFLMTNVEYALRNPEIGREFAAYLRNVDLTRF